MASVVALVGTGVVNGFLEVRSWEALWNTTYGWLLLAKVGLLVPLLALGAFNNRVSVPRLRAGNPSSRVRLRFMRAIGLELALMLVVVGVTAALVAEPPAKAQATGAGPVTREGEIGPYTYTVTVDPAIAGSTVVHAYILDSTGQLAPVDEIGLSGTLPAVDVGPLEFRASPAGPGHVVATAQLPLAGDWHLQLEVRKGDFDLWSTQLELPIRRD